MYEAQKTFVSDGIKPGCHCADGGDCGDDLCKCGPPLYGRENVLSFEEYSRFCFVWICYLGTIIAFEEKRHICVTIVSDLLKGTVKRAVVFVGRLIILAASGVVFYAGLLYLRRAVTYHTAATNTNMGVVVVGLPLTALCLIVIQAVDLYKACAGRRKKEG